MVVTSHRGEVRDKGQPFTFPTAGDVRPLSTTTFCVPCFVVDVPIPSLYLLHTFPSSNSILVSVFPLLLLIFPCDHLTYHTLNSWLRLGGKCRWPLILLPVCESSSPKPQTRYFSFMFIIPGVYKEDNTTEDRIWLVTTGRSGCC